MSDETNKELAKALRAECKTLGIPVANSMSVEVLQKKIDDYKNGGGAAEQEEIKDKESRKASSRDLVHVMWKKETPFAFNTPYGRIVIKAKNVKQRLYLGKSGDGSTYDGFEETLVPRNAWDYIVEKYGQTVNFRKCYIFAEETQGDAKAHAKDLKGLKTGKEQMTDPPAGVTDVEDNE